MVKYMRATSFTLLLLSVAATLTAQTGIINTIAGNGIYGYSGDSGPATSASINGTWDFAIDPAGNIYLLETSTYRVRKVSVSGVITTFAGTGVLGYSGDGGPATSAM